MTYTNMKKKKKNVLEYNMYTVKKAKMSRRETDSI